MLSAFAERGRGIRFAGFNSFLNGNVLIIVSHRIKAGSPSILRAASSAMTSASELEWETADCLLHTHVTGTKVLGPAIHRYAPFVDFESFKSPPKLASTNNANQQSSG